MSVGGRASCGDAFEAELRPLTTGAAAHIMRGQAARLAGQMDQAIAEFRQAVAAAPNDPIAHQALGKALAGQGDLAGALAEYQKPPSSTRTPPSSRSTLGLLLEQKGDTQAAGKLSARRWRRTKTSPPPISASPARPSPPARPTRPSPHSAGCSRSSPPTTAPLACAELLMELKRPAEALEDVRYLLDQSPPADPMEHASLAWAAAALGDPDRAEAHLQQIAGGAKIAPKARAAAHFRLASLRLERQDPAAARAELEAALVLDPGLEPARQLLDRLPR